MQSLWLSIGLLLLSLCIVSSARTVEALVQEDQHLPNMHTLFSVECNNYFDWQTVGLMHSYRQSGQRGPITRLLSCTDADLQEYRGMDLAPTLVVPSMSRHPKTGDWYPAINKPAGVVHWLQHSAEAKDVEWVVILDADMIIRSPIVPWELGAEKGKPVAADYGYLIGCDNILAKLHTQHPEYCDKVGGLLVMHIEDLRALAPLWLSKTEEVRADREHWATNITGDIYGQGWISEMYGYSFGAAEVGLRHKITADLMIYPGYVPREGVEPLLLHYGLRFSVGSWSFSKADHHDDDIVYDCNKLFSAPPYPKEVMALESDPNKRRGLFLSIECINTLNEGLLKHHESHGCSKPPLSKYTRFLRVWRTSVGKLLQSSSTKGIDTDVDMDHKKFETNLDILLENSNRKETVPKIHTLFSAECSPYFDWQTVGMIHSFELSGQPGPITRLLSCTDEMLKTYKGLDLAPTHVVPSYTVHPLTNDWYPAINKPAGVLHWLNHVQTDAEFVVILDADMILRRPITPWEFGAEKGHPVAAPYDYLIGCDNELAKLHTRYPEACDKVGGVIIMHVDDLHMFAPLWLHKTEEVRADKAHWYTNITGDIYGQGWISEMYGYSFGAAELKLRHRRRADIMLYPGYVPLNDIEPCVLHYGLEFTVGNWRFDKAHWHDEDMVNTCWKFFPDPPDPSSYELRRDTLSIECVRTLNNALYLHHKRRGCPEPVNENSKAGTSEDARKTMANEEGEDLHMENELEEIPKKGEDEVSEEEELLDKDADEGLALSQAETRDSNMNSAYEGRSSLKGNLLYRKLTGSVTKSPVVIVNPTYWMVAIWSLLVFIFLFIVSSFYSRQGQKQKFLKNKGRKYTPSSSKGETFNDSD